MRNLKITGLVVGCLWAVTSAAQSRLIQKPRGTDSSVLQGAGATFPYPLYSKWVYEYQKIDPKTRINYQSIGSGGGIRQLSERTVDFGASDTPMSDSELANAPAPVLHIPMTVGAVVLSYNIPSVKVLKLSQEAIAGIFLGQITSWNDPKIAAMNGGVALPNSPITVLHRSDGSGTTAVFTAYLASISPAWKEKVGSGKSVKFPVGLGAKGNEGVSGQVKTTPGSIGYIELAYAKQIKLPIASIRNKAGKFIEPSLAATSAAAVGIALPDDLRVSIVNPDAQEAYPIAAFTFILVYANQENPGKGKTLAQFLWWAVHDGQKFGEALDYAPLPAPVVSRVEAKLKGLTSQGKSLL